MRISFSGLTNALAISRLWRQLEQEAETVGKVLQPGPLGIVEYKFSADEINHAATTVRCAVETWRMNASLEKRSSALKDFIQK